VEAADRAAAMERAIGHRYAQERFQAVAARVGKANDAAYAAPVGSRGRFEADR
jgi:hypothetical protein